MSSESATSEGWVWGYVLHNLTCRDPLEAEHVAIVPHSDPRVQQIIATSKYGRDLVENFTDEMGHKREPSVLLIRENAPATVFTTNAVVGFRNIVALSCITHGWQLSIGGPNVMFPLYSDYFDFYPTTLTKDGTRIITLSPALSSFGQPPTILGHTHPGLPSTNHFIIEPDDMIVHDMVVAWKDLYIGPPQRGHEATALFRSLQIAYLAAAMPMGNERSIYDYGTHIALWVSALEILAHPTTGGGSGNADFKTVKVLLEKQKWSRSELQDSKYSVTYRSVDHMVNLVVSLYWELYQARNDFLHGNPVSSERLYPFKNKKRPPLNFFAPIIYKVALLGFLEAFRSSSAEESEDNDAEVDLSDPAFDRALVRALKLHSLERAILHAICDEPE